MAGAGRVRKPRVVFGDEFYEKTYSREPKESYERIFSHTSKLFPGGLRGGYKEDVSRDRDEYQNNRN